MGNVLAMNFGEAIVAPEKKILLDGLLNLTCHCESRSEKVEKVGYSALPILVKLVVLLLDLLVQFSAAGINEEDIHQTTRSPVLVREALVDALLPRCSLPLGDLVLIFPKICLRLIPPIRRVQQLCLTETRSLEIRNS